MHSVADENGKLRYYLNGESVKDSINYIHIIFQVTSGNIDSCPEGTFKYYGEYGSAFHETEIPCRFDLNTHVLADDEIFGVIFEVGDIQIGNIKNDAELHFRFCIDNDSPEFKAEKVSKYSYYMVGQTINYKVRLNSNWDVSYGANFTGGDASFTATDAGTYRFTVDFINGIYKWELVTE